MPAPSSKHGPHGAPIPRVASVCISCRRGRWLCSIACHSARPAPLAALLADAWPMRVTGVHRLEFEAGRVVLTLAVGDVADVLQKLWLRADAFNLRVDPADDPRSVCKTLARVAGDTRRSSPTVIRCCGARWKLPVSFAIRRRKKRKRPSPPASRRAGACGGTNRHSPSQHRTAHAIVIGAGSRRLRGHRAPRVARLAHHADRPQRRRRPRRLRQSGRRVSSDRLARRQHRRPPHARVFSLRVASLDRTRKRGPRLAAHARRPAPDRRYARRRASHRRRHRALRLATVLCRRGDAGRSIAYRRYRRCARRLVFSARRCDLARRDLRGAMRDGGRRAHAPLCHAGHAHRARRPRLARHSIRPASRSRKRRSSCSRTRTTRCGWRTFTASRRAACAASSRCSNIRRSMRCACRSSAMATRCRLASHRTLTGATYDIDSTDREIRAAGHLENLERIARMLPSSIR